MKKKKSSGQYFKEFDLTKDPFPVGSFDNVLFLTPELTNRLHKIKNLIAETDKMIVVSSVSGAGKSTLADYLESIKEKNWKACLVQAVQDMDRETLAYEIIQQVSPDKADEKNLSIPQLHKFLEFASRTEKVPVFIIDDADKLPVETLEFILELSALKYQETSFHFVLFSNEAIMDKLNNEKLHELSSQLVTSVHLPSLSKSQLKEYIDNRLGSSGEINEYPFTEADIEEIYTITGGLPHGINIMARRLMEDRTTSGTDKSKLVMASIAAAVVILAGGGYFLTGSQDNIVEQSQPVTVVTPPPQSQPPALVTTPPPDELIIQDYDVSEISTDAPQVADDTMVASRPDASSTIEPEVPEEEDATLNNVEDLDNQIQAEEPVLTMDDPEASPAPETVPQDTVPVFDGPLATNVATSSTADAPVIEPGPPVTRVDTEAGTIAASTVTTGVVDNIYKLDSVPAPVRGLKGEDWYRQQSRSSYVLQLISASDIQNVLTLLDGLEDFHEDMSGYVKYTPSGRPRFLLFFGHYPDRQTASNSSSALPDKLRSITPYPRSIGSIIDEIETVGSYPY